MRIIKISKGNGKFRTIYAPNRKEKRRLRRLSDSLTVICQSECDSSVHGFITGRSPVTNARCHVGFRYTVTFDLRNFFDSVTPDMVKRYLNPKAIKQVFIDGAPRQGLPTSPAVANLAAIKLDSAIKESYSMMHTHVYTRYADDLTFSTNSHSLVDVILITLPKIVSDCGFEIAPEKTHVYDAKAGLRPITGVAVGDTSIHPTRRVKRKLRAAIHQGNLYSAAGLAEWCKLKAPGGTSTQVYDNLLDYVTKED